MSGLPLTEAQADGLACLACAGWHGAMVPVGTFRDVQLFAHPSCEPSAVAELAATTDYEVKP